MATYSLTGNTYTDKTDNTDTILAAHVNDLQDEVELIEATLMGTRADDLDIAGTLNANVLTSDGAITAVGAITGASFVGTNALYRPASGCMMSDNVTTGIYSTGFGSGVFAGDTTTGTRNTAVGYQTGYSLNSGGYNCLFGHYAGFSITSGTDNIIVGALAGDALTTQGQNVMIGRNSGSNSTGSANIFIGNNSGFRQTTNSNLLIIDSVLRADAAAELAGSLIYGIFNATAANQEIRFNVGKMGFYATAAQSKQAVAGARDETEGALASLLTALATIGLITDSTTAS